ncbi:hypothetical protein BC826DRAFT_966843 [Russula brevipes]|nr:hypothetical protein BC826DRAFT_966843 [Russula brevipes]
MRQKLLCKNGNCGNTDRNILNAFVKWERTPSEKGTRNAPEPKYRMPYAIRGETGTVVTEPCSIKSNAMLTDLTVIANNRDHIRRSYAYSIPGRIIDLGYARGSSDDDQKARIQRTGTSLRQHSYLSRGRELARAEHIGTLGANPSYLPKEPVACLLAWMSWLRESAVTTSIITDDLHASDRAAPSRTFAHPAPSAAAPSAHDIVLVVRRGWPVKHGVVGWATPPTTKEHEVKQRPWTMSAQSPRSGAVGCVKGKLPDPRLPLTTQGVSAITATITLEEFTGNSKAALGVVLRIGGVIWVPLTCKIDGHTFASLHITLVARNAKGPTVSVVGNVMTCLRERESGEYISTPGTLGSGRRDPQSQRPPKDENVRLGIIPVSSERAARGRSNSLELGPSSVQPTLFSCREGIRSIRGGGERVCG